MLGLKHYYITLNSGIFLVSNDRIFFVTFQHIAKLFSSIKVYYILLVQCKYCSRTPFHVDVYSSYSWSVNITGLKKWILLPPGEENKLKDSLGNLPMEFKPEKYDNILYYEVIQSKGDALFVPSGWHHQVTNLQDTISINHNWINGCNLHKVWNALEEQLKAVEQQIEELRMTPEFISDCQIMLKSLFGMNYESFLNFLIYIAEKRLLELKKSSNLIFNKFIFGKNHTHFDLLSILKIFNIITNYINHYEKYFSSNVIEKVYHLQSLILKIN